MLPFPTEPTPDDITGASADAQSTRTRPSYAAAGHASPSSATPTPLPTTPPVRLPGRIQLHRLGRGHTVALAATGIVTIASFLPWYQAHVAPIHGWSAIDPCPPTLHGSDRQICEDEHRGGSSVITVSHPTWAAWNTPRAWVAVLVVLALGVLLVRQTMPAYRPLPALALVGLVTLADLIVLQAIVFLPSPGPDLSGDPVPGDQAWRPTWGIYVVLPGMLAMTIGIAIDYLHTERATPSAAEPAPPTAATPE
jgi:hypothetical protein